MTSTTTTYDLLWSHQVMLLREIDSMNHQVAVTRQALEHAEYVLTQESSSRKTKKKSLWVRSTTKRSLRDRERDIAVLFHNLNVTQAQIANAHQATRAFLAGGEGVPQGPFPPTNGWTSGTRFEAPPDEHFPQNDWTCSRAVSSLPTNTNFGNIDDTLLRPPVRPTLGRHRDSGFDEPPLFAHPFDLDTTANTDSHVFAHEMLVSPMSTVPTASSAAGPRAVPAVSIPGGSMPTGGRTTPTLDPTADEFNFTSPSSTVPEAKVQNRAAFAVPALFDSTSYATTAAENLPNLDPSAPSFVPPISTGEDISNAKHKRCYSEAAIDIIENRLRDKNNQQPQAPWEVKKNFTDGRKDSGAGGNVYRRRGKSIADVAVQMVYLNNKGMEIKEEMIWPLTA